MQKIDESIRNNYQTISRPPINQNPQINFNRINSNPSFIRSTTNQSQVGNFAMGSVNQPINNFQHIENNYQQPNQFGQQL
jgi:hypothetical protein